MSEPLKIIRGELDDSRIREILTVTPEDVAQAIAEAPAYLAPFLFARAQEDILESDRESDVYSE